MDTPIGVGALRGLESEGAEAAAAGAPADRRCPRRPKVSVDVVRHETLHRSPTSCTSSSSSAHGAPRRAARLAARRCCSGLAPRVIRGLSIATRLASRTVGANGLDHGSPSAVSHGVDRCACCRATASGEEAGLAGPLPSRAATVGLAGLTGLGGLGLPPPPPRLPWLDPTDGDRMKACALAGRPKATVRAAPPRARPPTCAALLGLLPERRLVLLLLVMLLRSMCTSCSCCGETGKPSSCVESCSSERSFRSSGEDRYGISST